MKENIGSDTTVPFNVKKEKKKTLGEPGGELREAESSGRQTAERRLCTQADTGGLSGLMKTELLLKAQLRQAL